MRHHRLPRMARQPHARAHTTLILCLPNMIGRREQVDLYRATNGAAGSLPQWYRELSDQYPGHRVQFLESPHDVVRFFRAAETDPRTPLIGLVSSTSASLGCGADHGCDDHRGTKYIHTLKAEGRTRTWALRRDAAYFTRPATGPIAGVDRIPVGNIVDLEEAEWKDLKERRNALRRADQAIHLAVLSKDERKAAGELTPEEIARGVSPRTMRRDAMLRQQYPLPRYGLTCPHCGRLVRTDNGKPADAEWLKEQGLRTVTCQWCCAPLGTMVREQNNTIDQERFEERWAAQHHRAYDLDGNPRIPWGSVPVSNPRVPLAWFIAQRYAGWIDVLIADEVHKFNGVDTEMGRAFGWLCLASHKIVAGTATIFNGKTSSVFYTLLRMRHRWLMKKYGWNGVRKFIRDFGKESLTESLIMAKDSGGHFSGKPAKHTQTDEANGITPQFVMLLQSVSVTALLKYMGFKLPAYNEEVVWLDLPADLLQQYKDFRSESGAVCAFGGHDALGRHVRNLLRLSVAPWQPARTWSKHKDKEAV